MLAALKKKIYPEKKEDKKDNKLDPPTKFFFLFMAMAIPSALVERFSVSCMRDFYFLGEKFHKLLSHH